MPRRRLIVDGMNVVGSRPDGWWRDRPAAMRALANQIAGWARNEGESVTVVFDGRPFDLDEEVAGDLRVEFASRAGPNAADDDIVAQVEADDRPEEICVVTSDHHLARRVGELGGEVIGARTFRRWLEG